MTDLWPPDWKQIAASSAFASSTEFAPEKRFDVAGLSPITWQRVWDHVR